MCLVYKGYSFYKHRMTKDGAYYWVCNKRCDKFHKCRAKVYSMQIGTKNMVKVINGEHLHAPDFESDT